VPDSKNVSGSARFSNNDIAQIERSERSTVINDTNQNSLKTDNGNPSISIYLEEDENGVMFFKAGEGFNPLLELDEKEYMIFMKAVMEGSGHDMIVIDCGNQVSMQMIRSMELSKRVFLVKDGRPENKGWRKSVGHLMDEESRKKIILADSL
jgi:hypothetical protein